MNDAEITDWLSEAWKATLDAPSTAADPEIDELCESKWVSIRYALLTQLLGKHADHRRDTLCLQRGAVEGAIESGRWDPRGFCTAVVVPWVQASDNVLGSSPDPYVNKPLRRRRLDDWSVALRDKQTWEKLVALLTDVQERNSNEYTEQALRRCLAGIGRRYAKLNVDYSVPNRVSVEQCEAAFARFIEQPSGGEAPLIAATALLRVAGSHFSLFDAVDRQRINESDSASGAPGDIQCYRGDPPVVVLSVEVKDRDLTLRELNSSITKARQAGVTELLFAAPSLAEKDAAEAEKRVRDEWVQGTNVYRLSLPEMLHVVAALVGEAARVKLLRAIGEEINATAAQPSLRIRWTEVLEEILP